MFRIDGPGATNDNKFTEGDPSEGARATVVSAEWLNAVQEEIANAIEAGGRELDKQDPFQLADLLSGRVIAVDSVAAMTAISSPVDGWHVSQAGNEPAIWAFDSQDLSAEVVSEPEIYKAPDGEDGESGAWVRQWGYEASLAIEPNSGTDFNDVDETGFYKVPAGSTNVYYEPGTVIHVERETSGASQLNFALESSDLAVRSRNSAGVWQPWVSLTGSGPSGGFSVQLDENAYGISNGDSISPFSGDTGSLSLGTGELELTGAGSSVYLPIRAVGNETLVCYGSVRSDVTNWTSVRLNYEDGGNAILFFNYNGDTESREAGTLSIITRDAGGTIVSSSVLLTGQDFTGDFKFVIDWFKATSTGSAYVSVYDDNGADLVLLGSAAVHDGTTQSPITELAVRTDSTAYSGTAFIQYLQASRPNFTSIGDSVCAGHNGYDPDPSFYAGVDNYQSSWQSHLRASLKSSFPTLRNNFVANHGVGSETSTDIVNRVDEALVDGAKVFINGSAHNDFGANISYGTRNDNIGQTLARAKNTAALVVNLGCVVPNTRSGNYPFSAEYFDYWNRKYSNFRSADIFVDIMESGIREPGEIYAALSFTLDQIHPNVSGYTLIGQYIGEQIAPLIEIQ